MRESSLAVLRKFVVCVPFVLSLVFGFWIPSQVLAKGAGLMAPPAGATLGSPAVTGDLLIEINQAGNGWDWEFRGTCGMSGNRKSTEPFEAQGMRLADANQIAEFQQATAEEVASSLDGYEVNWPDGSSSPIPCQHEKTSTGQWVIFIEQVMVKTEKMFHAQAILLNYHIAQSP